MKAQVAAFKLAEAEFLKSVPTSTKRGAVDEAESTAVAKLAEEMKALPARVADKLAGSRDGLSRRRQGRRLHPMMIDEIVHMVGEPGDPVGLLMVASLIRDEAPWLYELVMEVYRAAKDGDRKAVEREMAHIHRLSEFVMRGPFLEEVGIGGKESRMFILEVPRMLDYVISRTLAHRPTAKSSRHRRKPQQSADNE